MLKHCTTVAGGLQEGPGEAAVQAVGEAVETPERLWTPAMKAATAEELAHLANQAHAAQVCRCLLCRHLISLVPAEARYANLTQFAGTSSMSFDDGTLELQRNTCACQHSVTQAA